MNLHAKYMNLHQLNSWDGMLVAEMGNEVRIGNAAVE